MLKDANKKDAQISAEQDVMTLEENNINDYIADQIELDKEAEVSAYDPIRQEFFKKLLFGETA